MYCERCGGGGAVYDGTRGGWGKNCPDCNEMPVRRRDLSEPIAKLRMIELHWASRHGGAAWYIDLREAIKELERL